MQSRTIRRLVVIIVLVLTIVAVMPLVAQTWHLAAYWNCTNNAYVPYGSGTGYAYIACTTTAYRTTGGQLKEDVAWAPDPVIREVYGTSTAANYSWYPSKAMWWDNDGNQQGYFTKAYSMTSTGNDYSYRDSGRYWTHYEWR